MRGGRGRLRPRRRLWVRDAAGHRLGSGASRRAAVRDRFDDAVRRRARRCLGVRCARRGRLRARGGLGLEVAAGVAAAGAAGALGPPHGGGRGRARAGCGDAALGGRLVERVRALGGWLQPARLALRARGSAHLGGGCARRVAGEADPATRPGRAAAVLGGEGRRRWLISGLAGAAARVGMVWAARRAAALHWLLRGGLVRRQRLPLDLVGR
jgi:hypothetical protein